MGKFPSPQPAVTLPSPMPTTHPSSRPRWQATARRLAATAAVVTTACSPNEDWVQAGHAARVGTDSMGVRVELLREVRSRARAGLVEGSAAVVSALQPGVVFSVNDAGNDATLFAVDTSGSDRGAWRVTRARNVDWEALAAAPCGAEQNDGAADERPVTPLGSCLYIGDTGDNDRKRTVRTIYRIREPLAADSSYTGRARASRLDYRYADGRHDVEAMYVSADGTTYLITKRPLRGARRALRPALVYSLAASAWGSADTAVAQLADSLPIVPGSARLRLITDASLSRDGRLLAVRTYGQVFVFATDSATGRVRHEVPPAVCDLSALDERTGEGVAWLPGSTQLVLTREGRRAPLSVVKCPTPRLR